MRWHPARAFARWVGTTWGQRIVMAWCAAVQVWNLSVQDTASWAWWVAVAGLLFLAGAQGVLEVRRRHWRKPPGLEWRIEQAMATEDPMGAMARMAYLDTLTRQQLDELVGYLEAGRGTGGRWVDLDDVPQVVKGFVLAGLPPEERDGL